MINKNLDIPQNGIFATEDNALSKKRKELAERLKTGQAVSVTPTGTLVKPDSPEAQQQEGKNLNIPVGKLAGKALLEISELEEMDNLLEIEALTIELMSNRVTRLKNRISDNSLAQKRAELALRLKQGIPITPSVNSDGTISVDEYPFAKLLGEKALLLHGLSINDRIVFLRKIQSEIDDAVNALQIDESQQNISENIGNELTSLSDVSPEITNSELIENSKAEECNINEEAN
ncbi:MAG: hypothetical protein LBM93_03425 [Oscillospiraceae bacterium]|jgi:hypothetical protein|nr:hypothetical protein [Oscillospiraceae bacterium]